MLSIESILQQNIHSDLSDYMRLNRFQEAKDLLDKNYDHVDVMYGEGRYFRFAVRYENSEMLKTLLQIFEATRSDARHELKEVLQYAINQFGSTPEIDILTSKCLLCVEEEKPPIPKSF